MVINLQSNHAGQTSTYYDALKNTKSVNFQGNIELLSARLYKWKWQRLFTDRVDIISKEARITAENRSLTPKEVEKVLDIIGLAGKKVRKIVGRIIDNILHDNHQQIKMLSISIFPKKGWLRKSNVSLEIWGCKDESVLHGANANFSSAESIQQIYRKIRKAYKKVYKGVTSSKNSKIKWPRRTVSVESMK